jgi:murein DD-endopeptidase MepM/ murein hydrolase activator NlpD
MTQRSPQDFQPVNPYRLLQQGMGLMGGLGILASGFVWIPTTSANSTFIIPDNTTPSAPSTTAVEFNPPAPPREVKPIVRENRVRATVTQVTPTKAPAPQVNPKPSANDQLDDPTPKTQLSAPKISVPSSTVGNNASQSTPVNTVAPLANPGKNDYIDTTNYSQGNTDGYTAPSSVILSDRATGCSSISQNGQLTNGICGTTTRKPISLATKPRSVSAPIQVATRTKISSKQQVIRRQSHRTEVGSVVQPPASIALAPVPKYNRATTTYDYPQVLPQPRNTSLIFPLSIPANITSGFGWRVHPITETTRMHAGTDLGAPLGTPVLAAYGGEVAVADWMGGYGLTVILRHEEGTQESRYTHLSEIFVNPGDSVEQGTVIGRVGSTGLSTGPHLHFEWRHLTAEGWVAVDAGLHLEYALDNLLRAMEIANSASEPQG